MRAQNEPPLLEVRAAEPVGEPTDVPGAYVVDAVDLERMRPMSRASQLAALVVGAQDGERILDLCAAPGGKSMMLAGRCDRGRGASRPRAGDGEERRAERPRRHRRRPRARRDAGSTARSSTRRAPVSACSRGVPTCAGARGPLPELQLELLLGGRGAHPARRHDRLLGVHAERRRERGGRRRLGPRAGAARHRVAPVRAPEAAGVPPHAPAPRPDERLLHRAVEAVGSGRGGLAGLDPDGRGRAVALRRGLRAARRPAGASCCAPGCRVFHFDVGDGHFVEPITMGPIVLQSISPLIHRSGAARSTCT